MTTSHTMCSADTVFEYFVEPKQRQWMTWESKLSSTYRPPPETPFFKILVSNYGVLRLCQAKKRWTT
eukprot:1157259-Pelagomonas_calceolata.AAC.15